MLLFSLLEMALTQKASDLHLSANLKPWLRVDGEMLELISQPVLSHESLLTMCQGIMTKEQQQIFETEWELDFACELAGLGRFRVNIFHQSRGVAAVFRVISDKVPELSQLNAPAIFETLTQKNQGLILVTGPTGSGKSTTLAALIDAINTKQACHILTIEDPIEFVHYSKRSLINQRQVHQHTRGFAQALRAALREDPDIILIGEMRDLETIRLALTAAETGHLVFGTLHTSSAIKTVDRVIDVFPAAEKPLVRSIFSESLQAVIAQRLVKKKTSGRVGVFEIMIATPAIRNLIREDKIPQMLSVLQTGTEFGMQTLDQALQKLLQQDIISMETAALIAHQPNQLKP